MPRSAVILLTFTLLIPSMMVHNRSLAHAGSWIPKGPPGGPIESLAVDPLDPDIVYATTGTGIFKTTDGGKHWLPSTAGVPGGGAIGYLSVDPGSPTNLWAATGYNGDAFLLNSTDAGGTWTTIIVGDPFPVLYGMGIFGIFPATAYRGSEVLLSSGLFGLFVWQRYGATEILQSGSGVRTAAIDARSGTAYAAGAYGVFKTDGILDPAEPLAWARISDYNQAMSLAIRPDDPSTVYAGTYQGAVDKSVDGGATWTGVTFLPEFTREDGDVFVAIDPLTPDTLYAGLTYEFTCSNYPGAPIPLFKSVDGGRSWRPANNGLPIPRTVPFPCSRLRTVAIGCRRDAPVTEGGACDPAVTPTLYAATSDGVFKSTDRGESWSDVNRGLPSSQAIATIAIGCDDQQQCESHPVTPRALYALLDDGRLLHSSDDGDNWQPLPLPVPSSPFGAFVRAVAIDPENAKSAYVETFVNTGGLGNNVLWKTSNAGMNWTPAENGLPANSDFGGRISPITSLTIDPTNSTTLYAGILQSLYAEGYGVYKSTDGGLSWAPSNDGLPVGGEIVALAIDPQNPQTLYVAGDWAATSAEEVPVFRTSDGGSHWERANGLVPGLAVGFLHVHALAIGSEAGTVYAATDAGLLETNDSGANWNVVLPGYASSVITVSEEPGVVYAATQIGVFKSTDRGAHWRLFSEGLGGASVGALALHPRAATRIYAGTSGHGLFALAECGDGYLDAGVGELCDEGDGNGGLGSCCTKKSNQEPGCGFAAPGTRCRGSAGDCDLPDVCSGSGVDCVDLRKTGVVCREAKGACDVAEVCVGGVSCPPDGFASSDTLCRPARGSCDRAEFCSGMGASCPPDVLEPLGTPCGDAGDVCDGQEKDCPFKCGNGTVESELGEKCDDGKNNGTPGDSCRQDCQLKCGDGTVDPLEQCDGGQHCTPSCRLMCTDDKDCCAGDANCDRNNACTRALCEDGLCGTKPGCAGDPCTVSSDLAGVEGCFRQLGGARCRSPRDRKLANRVNRQLADRLAELQTLPDLCGSSRTQKRIPKLLKRVRRKLGQLQLLVARNVGDPDCYNELTGFAPASDGRLAFLDLQVQKLGVQAICQPAKPGA